MDFFDQHWYPMILVGRTGTEVPKVIVEGKSRVVKQVDGKSKVVKEVSVKSEVGT
jgi:hypothetical protein